MFMRLSALLFLFAALLLSACSGVETRPGKIDDFAAGNYHYYKWRSAPLANKGNSKDPLYTLDPVLRKQIDKALAKKGYVLDVAKAEFSVDYIFANGLRVAEETDRASNLSTYPGVIPNRDMDQASIDNEVALGTGVKETRNIALQFNDVARQQEVWHVVVSKIIENVNQQNVKKLDSEVEQALNHALQTLPNASK